MPTEFDIAVDTLFADPNLAVAGVFTAPPAAGVPVRILIAPHDPEITLGGQQSTGQARGYRAELNRAEVAIRPKAKIDTLTVGAGLFAGPKKINAVEESDLTWILDLRDAA